jgi:hypothetical protein
MEFIVNLPKLNIRLDPSTAQPAIATLVKDTAVTTTDQEFNDGSVIWREILEPSTFATFFVAERTLDRSIIFLRPSSMPFVPTTGRVAIQQVGNAWFFTIDGQLHRSIGVNIREFPWFGIFRATNLNRLQAYIDKLKDIKAKVVRFYAPLVDRNTDETIARNRQILDLLHQNNLMAIVVLNDALSHSSSWLRGEEDWHKGKSGLLTRDYFTPTTYTPNYLTFVKRMASEFQTHPAIFAWDLMNEPTLFFRREPSGDTFSGHFDASVTATHRANFLTFVKDAVAAIRQFDTAHLITLGLINTNQLGAVNPALAFATEIFAQLKGHLDFGQVHFYQKSQGNDDIWDEENRSTVDASAARSNQMPIVVGEFGSMSGAGDRVAATKNMLNRWIDTHHAALLLQWGFMFEQFPNDSGIGDDANGFDPVLGPPNQPNSTNRFVFDAMAELFRQKNTELAQIT